MPSQQDLNKMTTFENNIKNANQILYWASEDRIKSFFNEQDELIKSIADIEERNRLLPISKRARVIALSNNTKYGATLNKVKELTLNDGVLSCANKDEANKYFDLLDEDIRSIPTDESTRAKLLELSAGYRMTTLNHL